MRLIVFLISIAFSLIISIDAKIISSYAFLEISPGHTPEDISVILLAAFFLVAGLLIFLWPKASFIMYVLLGCTGIFASITGFTRLDLWGVPFVMAVLSYFGGQRSYQRLRVFKLGIIHTWFSKRARKQEIRQRTVRPSGI